MLWFRLQSVNVRQWCLLVSAVLKFFIDIKIKNGGQGFERNGTISVTGNSW